MYSVHQPHVSCHKRRVMMRQGVCVRIVPGMAAAWHDT